MTSCRESRCCWDRLSSGKKNATLVNAEHITRENPHFLDNSPYRVSVTQRSEKHTAQHIAFPQTDHYQRAPFLRVDQRLWMSRDQVIPSNLLSCWQRDNEVFARLPRPLSAFRFLILEWSCVIANPCMGRTPY